MGKSFHCCVLLAFSKDITDKMSSRLKNSNGNDIMSSEHPAEMIISQKLTCCKYLFQWHPF